MTAILACIAAFAVTFWAARVSVVAGIIATTTIGYFYGILRANLPTSASHFIFDASLVALYIVALTAKWPAQDRESSRNIKNWLYVLIGWPVLVLFLPFQPLLVSLVGFRGNVFMLPLLAIGARLKDDDITKLTYAFACLNIAAFGFGIAEYFMGIERFFPNSAVTQIMYASSDAGGGHYRIPSIFSSAHAYAGSMVYTIPLLFGAWVQKGNSKLVRKLLALGLVSIFGGILLASTRQNLIFGVLMVGLATLSTRMTVWKMVMWVVFIMAAAWLISTNERFSRFKNLDTEILTERVGGSVNRNFLEILFEYPMGNGLGGGGTSLPYFLQGMVRVPIGVENEYSRIMLEEGIPGLLIWLSFIIWFVANSKAFKKTKWLIARRLVFAQTLAYFFIANIGLGLLTAIPASFLFFLLLGWILTKPTPEKQVTSGRVTRREDRVQVRRIHPLAGLSTAPIGRT